MANATFGQSGTSALSYSLIAPSYSSSNVFYFLDCTFRFVVGGVNKEHLVAEVKVQLSQLGPTGMAAPGLFLGRMVENSDKHLTFSHRNGRNNKGQFSFSGSCTATKKKDPLNHLHKIMDCNKLYKWLLTCSICTVTIYTQKH